MKTVNKFLSGVFVSLFLVTGTTKVFSQTAGSLTFSCLTSAPSGSWGNKHVLAIWIENTQNPSRFIKTKAKYGYEDDHLTSWATKSGKNLVDAITGATLGTYDTRAVIWDGTDVNKNVVADGTYNVFIEMGWGKDKVAQHSVNSYTFTKGAEAVHLTPAGNSNYSNITIDWRPAVTFSAGIHTGNPISVFPNPTNGAVKLDFKHSIPSAKLSVENALGSKVYEKIIQNDFTGILPVDLSAFSNGLYLVKINSPEQTYTFKVILNK